MGIGDIKSSGFISSIPYDKLESFYITKENYEIIEFRDYDGTQRQINSLIIESGETGLYIRILPSYFCLFIPANSFKTYDFESLKGIQVMNPQGTEIRWAAMYF